MYLRKSSISDLDILYKWVNDPIVRENAFNTSNITYLQHKIWYKKSLESSNRNIFICIEKDIEVGQIRIDKENNIGIISYSVDKSMRGKGIGSRMLEELGELIKAEYSEISILKGLVKKQNKASRNVFKRNGYKEEEELDYVVYTLKISR